MSRLGNNPLLKKNKEKIIEEDKIVEEKIIKEYGRLVHLSKEVISMIDFNDKEFINRIYEKEEELDVMELMESIKEIGLINIIYLQEKENNKFKIISGLRRLSACKNLYEEGIEIKAKDRLVILTKDTPYSVLDKISVDENIKRKDLSILEQSFKYNREASKKNKKIEEILEEYNISRKNFYRIKNAITYPQEIINIIEELGADKAETLNKIVNENLKKGITIEETIKENKDKTRKELRDLLKEMKKGTEKETSKIDFNKNSMVFKVNKKLPFEVRKYFEKIKYMLDNEDYSFIK